MVDESRKPALREIWRTHKPNEWHRLVGTSITRQEWEYLCDVWLKTQKPVKGQPEAFNVIPNVADDDIKRLEQELG